MNRAKFVAALVAAFTVTDLYLNNGNVTHAAWARVGYAAFRFNQMVNSLVWPFA
jgi:hypothetical protein